MNGCLKYPKVDHRGLICRLVEDGSKVKYNLLSMKGHSELGYKSWYVNSSETSLMKQTYYPPVKGKIQLCGQLLQLWLSEFKLYCCPQPTCKLLYPSIYCSYGLICTTWVHCQYVIKFKKCWDLGLTLASLYIVWLTGVSSKGLQLWADLSTSFTLHGAVCEINSLQVSWALSQLVTSVLELKLCFWLDNTRSLLLCLVHLPWRYLSTLVLKPPTTCIELGTRHNSIMHNIMYYTEEK